MKSKYRYNLITTKRGLIPIEEVVDGDEVLSLGEWKKTSAPVKDTVTVCEFDTLPTVAFEKECVMFKREVSISHSIKLNDGPNKSELSIRGYFKEDKNSEMTLFFGTDTITYWVPRFIRFYDMPMLPFITAIGYNLYHPRKKAEPLKKEEITERNLEYILEGMNRRTFSYTNGKYNIYPASSWNETHRITMRLLDIECQVHSNTTVVKNVISFYRHIKDEYTKNKIKDEDIVFNLKRSNELPLYTNGHKIIKKHDEEGLVLKGINPDINTMNPVNCYEKGFTTMNVIRPDNLVKRDESIMEFKKTYLSDNFFSLISNKD